MEACGSSEEISLSSVHGKQLLVIFKIIINPNPTNFVDGRKSMSEPEENLIPLT